MSVRAAAIRCRLLAAVLETAAIGCTHAEVTVASVPQPHHADQFLTQLVRPWPPASRTFALAVSSRESQRVSSYDNALLALYELRRGRRQEAAKLLQALAALQTENGAIPFTFAWPLPATDDPYVRSGAVAWVGYAATEYLNADRGGPARDAVVRLAHGAAKYLIDRQVQRAGDVRDGLVLAGIGAVQLELDGDRVREHYTPGEVAWASTEHNVDAFFFLRDFGALTGEARFTQAAERIRAALLARGFSARAGQLVQGFSAEAVDEGEALDCASWGALFLIAADDRARAENALANAEWRYASHDRASGARGHRPYAHQPIVANPALAAHFDKVSARNWDDVDGVWPEGSAGVALANLRLGRRERAEEILQQLEKLRDASGGLPTFSADVPIDFDRLPSLAGTVWIALVRAEIERGEVLWRRR